ncbi:hypothetical protein EST38_g2580 [Candolleomyces aberdarensis]|uniref:AA9 family lytic polysaccharide monooxygenase n=1 Tax=Candolleomyces aberdarensis TaxID=2316362 RepID=A0A4Q2DSL7_9AGAR|nr:hypothetical protein EST38_g2580 [Candolleomyces aberdarensis]
MRLTSLVALASAITGAMAHATVFGVWVNGVDQGNGQNRYIRSPPNNSPVKDLTSRDLICNTNNRVVSESVSVKSGDKLTFEWQHDNRDDDIIDGSHQGPVLVYMAPASGNDWTKIFEDGHNGASWAVDRLKQAHGQHSVIIPDVPAGDYIFRTEIIALHEGDTLFTQNPARGAQLYPSCVQIKVTSNGNKALPGGTVFPGAYTDSSPGILFNLYGGPAHSSYKSPGPAVWSEAQGGDIARVGIPGQGPVAPTANPAPVTTTTTRATSATPSGFVTVRTSSTTVAPQPTTVPSTGTAALFAQCGGVNYNGPTACASGSTCVYSNDYYSQCLPASNLGGNNGGSTSTSAPAVAPTTAPGAVPLYGQCGGNGYAGSTTCAQGACKRFHEWYSQCLP